MAYYDWRMFMPDPNRPRLGQVLSNVADTLLEVYQGRKQRKAQEEFMAGQEDEYQRCIRDPNCDEAEVLAKLAMQAEGAGLLDLGKARRAQSDQAIQLAEERRARAVEGRRAFEFRTDPFNRSVAEAEAEGIETDSGMLQDIGSAITMREARDALAASVAEGTATPFQRGRYRCLQGGGADEECDKAGMLYEIAMKRDPDKPVNHTEQSRINRCIDTKVAARGGDPMDPNDATDAEFDDCVVGREMSMEAAKRRMGLVTEGESEASLARAGLSKQLRAQVDGLVQSYDADGDAGGLLGHNEALTNALRDYAYRAVAAGDTDALKYAPPTKALQDRLNRFIGVVGAPAVPNIPSFASESEIKEAREQALIDKQVKVEAAQKAYMIERPALEGIDPMFLQHYDLRIFGGPPPQQEAEVTYEQEFGAPPGMGAAAPANTVESQLKRMTNAPANEEIAANVIPDQLVPATPVTRTGSNSLLALAGAKPTRTGERPSRTDAPDTPGTSLRSATMGRARAAAPPDYGETAAAQADDATASAALRTLTGSNRAADRQRVSAVRDAALQDAQSGRIQLSAPRDPAALFLRSAGVDLFGY